MPNTLTTNLSDKEYIFLEQESKNRKTTKKQIIEDALNLYRQKNLEKLVKDGLEARYLEYKSLNKEYMEVQNSSIKE